MHEPKSRVLLSPNTTEPFKAWCWRIGGFQLRYCSQGLPTLIRSPTPTNTIIYTHPWRGWHKPRTQSPTGARGLGRTPPPQGRCPIGIAYKSWLIYTRLYPSVHPPTYSRLS